MTASKIALFVSGLFFGGAIDHAILAAAGRTQTPYGLEVGVSGNIALGLLDLMVTAVGWFGSRWLERRR